MYVYVCVLQLLDPVSIRLPGPRRLPEHRHQQADALQGTILQPWLSERLAERASPPGLLGHTPVQGAWSMGDVDSVVDHEDIN